MHASVTTDSGGNRIKSGRRIIEMNSMGTRTIGESSIGPADQNRTKSQAVLTDKRRSGFSCFQSGLFRNFQAANCSVGIARKRLENTVIRKPMRPSSTPPPHRIRSESTEKKANVGIREIKTTSDGESGKRWSNWKRGKKSR